jgi:hypothetical protein
MTRELLVEANRLNHAIDDLENQIAIVEDMHHCDNSIQIRCDQIGEITIAGDDELKDDIIDMVLGRLNNAKDDLEDKLRLL